jgi:phosphohistidine phosphatase
MDLILWRHAEAEEGGADLARQLTPKGEQQAALVARWMLSHLPRDFRAIASPAVRAQQTAKALTVPFEIEKLLAPGASVANILRAAGWPRQGTVVVVGHQPDLGRVAAHLVAGANTEWRIDKAALWWLSGEVQASVRAVISADLL